VAYPGTDGSALLTASVSGLFEPGGGNWLWSGANLRPQDDVAGGFAAAYPANQLETIPNLETYLDETYAAIAEQLGQPTSTRATLYLYPDAPSLRADTSLRLLDNVSAWVGPGTIKLVYTSNITRTDSLQTALTQLVLAEAGLSEAEAAWLWHGLPLALPFREDTIAAQRVYLPTARSFLLQTGIEATADINWLPVEYVRQRVGWAGVAELITVAGQAGLDAGLQEVLNLTGNNFDARWQEFWRSRLTTAQTNLDRLLQTRMDTVLAGNLTGFLATVDNQVPLLRTEQEHWFAAAQANGLTSYSLIGTPIALLDNGDMLADLSVVYETNELGNGNLSQEVLLTVQGSTLRWADVPFQTLSEPGVIIYYQEGQALQAQNLLTRTLSLNSQLANLLPVTAVPTTTLKLYADAGAFRHSLMPGLAELAGVSAWSANGEALKLRLGITLPADDQLAQHLVRYQLSQLGVTDEWLLQGTALYYRERLPGITGMAAAAAMPAMLSALSRDQLFPFADIPPTYVLNADERKVTTPQAWDGIRYLVYTYGEERLTALLQAQAGGLDLNAALTSTLGQSLAEFQAGWVASVQRAHIQDEWVLVAREFEAEQALAHITALTQPALAGRVAGSEGAAAAAEYIAAQFAAYGLEPAGTEGYLQPFTVPYATLAAAPRLAIVNADGSFVEDFLYREEFLLTLGSVAVGGAAEGELVYVPDLSLSDLDLSGKIAVSPTGDDLVLLMQQAHQRGASALILVTNISRDEDYLAKQALAAATPPTQTVPLLLLTQAGYDHLLTATGLSRGAISVAPAALPMGGVWVSLHIPLSPIVQAETANVLALLPGSDPVLRNEFIVISAHYDHVGHDPDTWRCNGQVVTDERVGDASCEQLAGLVYSGANDNASGVAVMLELARLWQETGYQPARSILFVAWGAQEPGNVGATTFSENPTVPLENMIGLLNLDSVGGGPGPRLVGEGSWESAGSWLMAFNVANTLLDGRLRLELPSTGGDHVLLADQAVPAVLLTWQDAGDANWPDVIANEIDAVKLGNSGRILALTVMALAR
jgi:hypothetical protein